MNHKLLEHEVDMSILIYCILTNLKLVGCNPDCHKEDCKATKEGFSCSAPPQPHTHCCARGNVGGCCVTSWDCWKAHQIPCWWVKGHEGKIIKSFYLSKLTCNWSCISWVRTVVLNLNLILVLLYIGVFGPKGEKQYRIQVGDLRCSL